MTNFSKFLEIVGIILNFFGALAFARGFFISRDEAIRLGVSRYGSSKQEENLKLPAVQDRLNQRKWGIIGSVLVLVATCIQIWIIFS